jgi:hypothetical protein
MQHCSCTVYLGGDLGHSVWKADVTVAEIALLRAIHGEDACQDIQPTFMAKTKQADELERLRALYSASNITKEGKRMVDEVYPGRNPTLPVNLSDIGVEYGADGVQDAKAVAPAEESVATEDTAPAPTPTKKSRASKASDALLGSGED